MMCQENPVRLLHCGCLEMPYPELPGESPRVLQINQAVRRSAEHRQTELYSLLQREKERQKRYNPCGFSAQFSCQVMRLDAGYFSYFCDCYLSLGRIAPKLLRHGETYDMDSGQRLFLFDFFAAKEHWRQELYHKIQRQCYADRQPAYTYFLSHRIRLLPDQFYLSDRGLVLWMQAEEIAPYNTGIPSFLLTAEELKPVLRRKL